MNTGAVRAHLCEWEEGEVGASSVPFHLAASGVLTGDTPHVSPWSSHSGLGLCRLSS